MMGIKPKISIIVPIYNAGKYLRPALESVRAQTYQDWECVCVNDGSTDGSEKVVKEFAAADPRFILISQENSGVSAARNAGMDAARGEYIAFLDQDDLVAPDLFAIARELAEKYDADLVRWRYQLVPEDFQLSGAHSKNSGAPAVFYDNPDVDFSRVIRQKKYLAYFYVWMCLFRKELVKTVRFPTQLRSGGEDLIFMPEIADNMKNFVQSDAVLYFHRRSKISTTRSGFSKSMITHLSVTTPVLFARYMDNPRHKRFTDYIFYKQVRAIYYGAFKRSLQENTHIDLAMSVLRELRDAGVMPWKYINWKRRIYMNIFMSGRVGLARFLTKLL